MITLTGVGGVGKTLLASELARCATERYEHGAFMVDLAPLGEDDDIAGAICAVLGVQPQGDRPVPDALNDWLQGRSILLFFDNAEHLTDRLGPLIQTLLERCAEVTALVTSRSPVGIAAETLRTVPPLSAGDGVELFRQRAATAGRMDALLTDPQACEELCRRVDGLPLAIEVVAARTRTMTPSELLRRLDHRLASAALPESGRVDRHRTLRATVDWSYRLLDHDEQVLFARLSTFSGSFDLEAVERVCAFGMLDVDSVVDLVDGLVGKSVVAVDRSGSTTRFRLLEVLRQYADEQLVALDRTTTRARHRRLYTTVAERADRLVRGAHPGAGDEILQLIWDNLRSAHAGALAAGDGEAAERLALHTWRHSINHVRVEHAEWVDRILATFPHATCSASTWGMAAYWHAYITGDEVQAERLALLVPRQATFARFTSSHSALSWALRFRQAM